MTTNSAYGESISDSLPFSRRNLPFLFYDTLDMLYCNRLCIITNLLMDYDKSVIIKIGYGMEIKCRTKQKRFKEDKIKWLMFLTCIS